MRENRTSGLAGGGAAVLPAYPIYNIVPIFSTERRKYLEENVVAGERHANMRAVNQ